MISSLWVHLKSESSPRSVLTKLDLSLIVQILSAPKPPPPHSGPDFLFFLDPIFARTSVASAATSYSHSPPQPRHCHASAGSRRHRSKLKDSRCSRVGVGRSDCWIPGP